VGFEPTNPAFERAKTVHALDRAATVVGLIAPYFSKLVYKLSGEMYLRVCACACIRGHSCVVTAVSDAVDGCATSSQLLTGASIVMPH
jgi:hypothetical protein